ncbi:MAG: hypothetical protein ABI675_10055 [Chitinophagaceae bacterium]
MTPVNNIVAGINHSMELELKEGISMEELKSLLSSHIHQLINNNFNKLVGILYRIDVSEIKLRRLLENNPAEDAGTIIAELIIERQIQKIKSRENYRAQGENSIDENEKW